MLGLKIDRKRPILPGSGEFYYSNFPRLFVKDNSVKIEQLDKVMLPILNSLNKVAISNSLQGFIITSGNDGSHKGSAKTLSKSNSLHYKNKAIDLSFREAVTNKPIPGLNTKNSLLHSQIKFLADPEGKLFDIIVEKDHVHIEFDPKSTETFKKPIKKESGYEREVNPIKYVHSDLKIKSVKDLLNKSILFSGYKDKYDEFINYKGKTEKTNRERVELLYIEGDKFDTLKPNTVLYLNPEIINWDYVFQKQGIVETSSFPMFFGEYRDKLEKDPAYQPSITYNTGNIFPVEYINHLVQVYVYSKALGEMVDLTGFCEIVTVNSTKNNSSFNLQCNVTSTDGGRVLINTFSNKMSYLQKILSENDLVFIRFESLENEKRTKIDFSNIAGNIYDFIGFISEINDNKNLGSSEGVVSISGQCLSKLFTNDEAIFFPIAAVNDSKTGNLIIGQTNQDKILKRFFGDGKFYTLFSKQYRSIESTVLFYINQLSNTGLIPQSINDIIFQSYKDRRQKTYKIKGDEVVETLTDGVYQIIKVFIDDAVKDRTIVDATVTNPEGSIMSLLTKICQEPLVELLLDTYGDTFNIIIRKPPFDKTSIVSFLEDNRTIYDLDISDVLIENLSFETNFYTWFQLNNKGIMFGSSQGVALSYLPILPINEYIEHWGSKSRIIESNYTRSNKYGSEDEKRQAISDLLYVVECDLYLPFSRRGTLVLAKGDRRLKKGSWVRYNKELFYIDSVSNSVSIDDTVSRSTTLQVSRGLVEKYITGVKSGGVNISYFNIVDIDNLRSVLEDYTIKGERSIINRNIIINKQVFEYFLNKNQFDG